MFNLILFGPPGSGKGTQSDLLIQHYGFLHLSTGELLRDQVGRETPLGIEARRFMDEGLLVPDEIVIGMIDSILSSHPTARGIIFDGFPRTVAQATALDKLLELKNTQIHTLLALDVPEEELKKRLLQRGLASGRSDDKEATIVKRITEYKMKTKPVADYYSQQDKLEHIKGTGSIEHIFDAIKQVLSPYVATVD